MTRSAKNNGKPLEAIKPTRTVVLVGLMGAGKTAVGKRLADRLGMPFVDADHAVEEAAGCTISEIFERHGEAAFREGERKVIARLLEGEPKVLATGGGAFMDRDTRKAIKSGSISIWLHAPVAVLLERVSRRNNRPLLKQGDPEKILTDLVARRYPIYGEADIRVESRNVPLDKMVDNVVKALNRYLKAKA